MTAVGLSITVAVVALTAVFHVAPAVIAATITSGTTAVAGIEKIGPSCEEKRLMQKVFGHVNETPRRLEVRRHLSKVADGFLVTW